MKAAINTLSRDTEKQLRATELSILTMNSVLLEDKEQNNRMKIDMTHCSEQKRILEWLVSQLDIYCYRHLLLKLHFNVSVINCKTYRLCTKWNTVMATR